MSDMKQVWRLCTEWQRVVDLNGVVNDRGRHGWTPTTEYSDCLPNCQPQVRYPVQIKCHNNAALFSNSRQCIWTVLSKTITTTAAMKVAMCEANQVSHSLLSSLFKKHLLSQEIIQTGKHMKKLVEANRRKLMICSLSSWNMNNKEMLSFQFHMDHHSMSYVQQPCKLKKKKRVYLSGFIIYISFYCMLQKWTWFLFR